MNNSSNTQNKTQSFTDAFKKIEPTLKLTYTTHRLIDSINECCKFAHNTKDNHLIDDINRILDDTITLLLNPIDEYENKCKTNAN